MPGSSSAWGLPRGRGVWGSPKGAFQAAGLMPGNLAPPPLTLPLRPFFPYLLSSAGFVQEEGGLTCSLAISVAAPLAPCSPPALLLPGSGPGLGEGLWRWSLSPSSGRFGLSQHRRDAPL